MSAKPAPWPLEIAEKLDGPQADWHIDLPAWAADQLRQLYHANEQLEHENATLRTQLEAIGAGGVEPLRKTNSLDALDESSHPDHFRGATKMMQAARQALEALEPIHHGNMTPMAESAWKDATAALREALEAQEPWTPDDMAYRPGGLSQSAAAEQESDDIGVQQDKRVFARIESIKKRAPQPARQPLTDTEIQTIWCSARNEGNQHGPFWFARAIEKAHGIGGEA